MHQYEDYIKKRKNKKIRTGLRKRNVKREIEFFIATKKQRHKDQLYWNENR